MAVSSVDLLARAMMTTVIMSMPMNAIPQILNLRVWMPVVPAPRLPRVRVSYRQPVLTQQYCRRVKEKGPARAKGVHTQTQKSKAAEC
jgi:hypothetical protein